VLVSKCWQEELAAARLSRTTARFCEFQRGVDVIGANLPALAAVGKSLVHSCSPPSRMVRNWRLKVITPGPRFRHLGRCDSMLVTSASGQRDEREAGKGDAAVTGVDSPNQRIDVHCLFFRASARWALNQSPVG
jgi:hypothetical protein